MKKQKFALTFYQIYENDSLKEYLEDMALEGWRLVKMGSIFLRFEACVPHPVRYCAEIMEKASAYASNQTSDLKQYREFCQEAGWDYVGTNGLIHVFCTEDMDAIPVETDSSERYERICRASKGTNRMLAILFLLLGLLNLYPCYLSGTLFCPQGYMVLLLFSAVIFFFVSYLLWKRRAKAALACEGKLPCTPWRIVRLRSYLFLALIVFLCAAYLLGQSSLPMLLPFLLIFLAVYALVFFLCSAMIKWLREKHTFSKGTNMLIYWGFSLLLCLLLVSVLCYGIIRFISG